LSTTNAADRQSGLRGEYFASSNFDGNLHRPRELTVPNSGKLIGVVRADSSPLFTRVDPQVDFNWWDGAPRNDLNDDDFGVRWTGYLTPPVTGAYELGAAGLNAFELYLDGRRIVRRVLRLNRGRCQRADPGPKTQYQWESAHQRSGQYCT